MVAAKTLTWTAVILVHGTVLVLVPSLLLIATGQAFPGESGALGLAGFVPVLVGCLTLLWETWGVTSLGKGTPAPFDPPTELVVRGPYRFVRNPMYVGDVFVLLGESLLFGSAALLAYTLVMLGVFHLFVVLYEEPNLGRRFGRPYERYCRGVPRWWPSRGQPG